MTSATTTRTPQRPSVATLQAQLAQARARAALWRRRAEALAIGVRLMYRRRDFPGAVQLADLTYRSH